MISKIKEADPKNENIKKIIVFDESVNYTDLMKLYNEFEYDRSKIESSVKIYRNTGLVIDLVKATEEHRAEWKPFLQAVFPKKDTISKKTGEIAYKISTYLFLAILLVLMIKWVFAVF